MNIIRCTVLFEVCLCTVLNGCLIFRSKVTFKNRFQKVIKKMKKYIKDLLLIATNYLKNISNNDNDILSP